MLPPFKTPPPGKRSLPPGSPVSPADDDNETVVLDRPSKDDRPADDDNETVVLDRPNKADGRTDDDNETVVLDRPNKGDGRVDDDNETVVLDRPSKEERRPMSAALVDDASEVTAKVVLEAAAPAAKVVAPAAADPDDDTVTGDEFTRPLPKNLGEIFLAADLPQGLRGSVRRAAEDDEHTNFRPFQTGSAAARAAATLSRPDGDLSAHPPPPPSPDIPLRPPAAGTPAAQGGGSSDDLTAFAPLTPERIQAQLVAAREARRIAHNGAPNMAADRGRALESDPLPIAQSPHPSLPPPLRLPPSSRLLGPSRGHDKAVQPNLSWAFALAAMAIVGSLATVAIVEGSGDDLLRMGAAFVDPSMAKDEAPPEATKTPTPSTQSISVLDLPPASPPPAPSAVDPSALPVSETAGSQTPGGKKGAPPRVPSAVPRKP